MAFSTELVDRISFGNLKLRIYNLTDVSNSGSDFYPGLSLVRMVKANNTTDATDHFKETVGAHSAATTKQKVTFTAQSNLDDGSAWIWGY